ncbi:SDR family oxidoreductase [Hymenobacter taeanensis]|uniref:SDR family oxidoreductase n=1 Tax=Hymenobacter taeanensis TaxID=2735321 RepID=A0A6M6BF74_9BACT|nr:MULTISPECIES: SDR family oxidoreductase [Hymenobacter]QJX46394.1 SDR family oxidoreductase [Hymenobacter taeanensis]UOQ80255.1 SDR family oxidoreductase [Hymenobacter sp. 5414T-23]
MHSTPQVVWITGASAGIGEALAHEYARQGARLILSARNQEALEKVAAACAPAETLVVPLDLAQPASFAGAIQEVFAHYGRLDVLLNNGGISQRSLVLETSLSVDRQLMEVNYFGTVALTKGVLPHLLQQGSGRIAVVSSLVGKFGTPYRSAYAASKHALHGFFDSLRAELTDTGVGVTIICPGFVKTGVSVNALTGDGTPLGTMDEATAKGLAPAELARQASRAIAQGRNEVYIGGRETWGVLLKRLAPGLFSKFLSRAKVR